MRRSKTSWRLLASGQLAFEQPRHQVIRDTFLHSAHHRGQMTVYLRLLGSKVPSVYGAICLLFGVLDDVTRGTRTLCCTSVTTHPVGGS